MDRFLRRRKEGKAAPDPPQEASRNPTPPKAQSRADTDTSPPESVPIPSFPDGVKALYDCPDATVDICFVHGLTGDRDGTWTARGQSAPWPETLLPPRLKKARILSYGYDAYVVRKSVATSIRLLDHAAKFLNDLTVDRDGCNASSRPLILVAHSLGGLVCKEAILLSRDNPEAHLRRLFACIKGIIFMGTPHKGSWMADWARIPARTIGLMRSTNKSLLGVLETNNQYLESIQSRFLTMLRQQREGGRPLEVTCFFEELPLSVAGTVVSKESAALEGYTSVAIHANHRDMARFTSAEDNGFKSLLGELRRWESQVVQTAPQHPPVPLDWPQSPALPQMRDCSHNVRSGAQRHFFVPFGRNRDFVGRESALAQVLHKIPPNADNDSCQRTAIEGLGGVGKTQVALEAAFRLRDEHPDCSVFWVPAVDVTSFENAYRDVGRRLGVAGIDDDKADVKALVKAALSSEDAGSWLLVVDNADDLRLLFGDAERVAQKTTDYVGTLPLAQFLPFSRRGSILFTTRNRRAAVKLAGKHLITIGAMDPGDARKLLETGLADCADVGGESTARLLELLANLPLAIRQASAYMNEQQMSTSQYLRRFESSSQTMIKLLSKDFEDEARYSSIKNPVATTWLISFEHISQNPLAAQYLRFMCFIAEKDIPQSLLPPADDELEADEAIGTLKAYAFISQREGQDSFDMHRLVRLAMRNWLDKMGQLKSCRVSVLQRLAEAFPFPTHENRDVWMKYLRHTQTALELGDDTSDVEGMLDLLFNTARSYSLLGKYVEAETMYRRTLKLGRKLLGAEHPNTFSSENNLAAMLHRLGKYEESEAIHRQTLKLREKVLGAEHPDTLISINNLGQVLASLGKYKEAEAIYRQAWKSTEKVLGGEHPGTLASMNNLGDLLYSLGKYKEAEAIHRQVLELMEKVLGGEHPDTLASMDNLALVLGSQGKYKEGEAIHRQVLELKEKVLGGEHPDTLASMNNLGDILYSLGKYKEAEAIHRQVLELMEKVLGGEHPDTLTSMNNLALVLGSQGKYKEAEAIHRKEWKLTEKAQGAEHPDTLTSMNNLALVLGSQGKYKEGEAVCRQTLKLMEKVLGAEHPDTLTTVDNLASMLEDQGKHEEARTMYQQVLGLRTRLLGAGHPDTLRSMNNLALVLDRQGEHEEARETHRQVLGLRAQMLGAEHPDTLKSMSNLAFVLDSQGKHEEARTMHRQVLKLRVQVLGAEHPDTLESMRNVQNEHGERDIYDERSET